MILISDSGATKADFACIDGDGDRKFITSTLGLNPEVVSPEIFISRLEKNSDLVDCRNEVTEFYFYGAGCGTDRMAHIIQDIFKDFFPNAKILVKEDIYSALYATVIPDQPAIVCILGTGSNCSYWDGKTLSQKVKSLGYVIMDDSSGNYFGKQLIRDYYFGKMPKDLAKKMGNEFNMDSDYLKEHIYKQPNPNRFLAAFAKFMILNKDFLYVKSLVSNGFHEFIRNSILRFDNCRDVPVHFVGSIAYYLKDELSEVMSSYGLTVGNIRRRPIEGLLEYYKKYGF